VQQESGKGMLILVDRRSGKAMTVSLHESEEALRGTEEAFQARFGRASGSHTGSANVEVYEVAAGVRL
jgi:formylmethanofuran dehydrogenase subunit E